MQISMDDLEQTCWECHGEGKLPNGEKSTPCPKCSGKGYVLTALGQTILDFVKKNIYHQRNVGFRTLKKRRFIRTNRRS